MNYQIFLLGLTFCAILPVFAHNEALESLYIKRLNKYDNCLKTFRAINLERQIADQRLKVEREIQDLRKESQYNQEDFSFVSKSIELQGAGVSTGTLEAAKAASDISRNLEKEVVRIKRASEDEAQQRQKTLEDFKKTGCKY